METVFDALKAMGKATSIELAARLDISREEVLNELWELKKAGFVDKSAYTWRVADNNVQQEQPAQAELPEEITTATVAKISECDLTATMNNEDHKRLMSWLHCLVPHHAKWLQRWQWQSAKVV